MPEPTASIRRLDPQVANQIAAGEVVERPASVVKELVENSLDAGATRVEVHLEDGGRKLIRIVDNGRGIAVDDARLAFERHATSKIAAVADLVKVATYGFRGEALASIAAVARIVMTTRRAGDNLGCKVVGEGDGTFTVTPVSCAPGTDLAVADLFGNVPARRAFLRTAATELGHAIRLLDGLALARIGLHLLLFHNGRKVSDHAPASDLLGRARAVLGADVARHLQPVQSDGDYRVEGALSSPILSRGSSAGLTLIVDGRPVADKTLVHAVRAAYGTRLPERRHPVGVLAVYCPPATVDVNVHPAKTEVRFLSKQAVHAAAMAAVSEMLQSAAWLQAQDASVPVTRKGALPLRPARPPPTSRSSLPASRSPRPPPSVGQASLPGTATPVAAVHSEAAAGALEITLLGADLALFASPLQARFVGEAQGRWLLFDSDAGLLLVDRATAAQTATIAAGGAPHQRLMIPLHVALGPPLVAALVGAQKRLQRHGLELAESPRGGVVVRTAPTSMPRERIEALVRSLAGGLVAAPSEMSSATVHARIDTAIGRFVAPANGDALANADAARLAAAIDGVALPSRTPDGGPVVVRIAWDGINGVPGA